MAMAIPRGTYRLRRRTGNERTSATAAPERSSFGKAGAFQNHYDCGLVIQLAIDAELRSASGGRESLVTLWADFLDRAKAGAPWTGDTFLATARAHGLSEATARTITDLTTKPQKLDGARLRALLKL